MEKKEIFEVLQNKGAELSEWLRENFDPYAAILITDTEVKIIRVEFSTPTNYTKE